MKVSQDFVSQEQRSFKFKVGRYIASSLSGFIAGVIAASIIWLGVLWVANLYGKLVISKSNPTLIGAEKYCGPTENSSTVR